MTTLGVEAAISAEVTAAGVAAGTTDKYAAAAPATTGAAMDVPDSDARAVSDVNQAETSATPGANMSTQVPKFEDEARLSAESVAPTVIANGARAGE